MKHIAGQSIYDHSDKCEFLATTADFVALILNHDNLFGVKYFHMFPVSQCKALHLHTVIRTVQDEGLILKLGIVHEIWGSPP